MKHVKKLFSAVLVLVMALPVAAEEKTYSITINNEKSGHTYEAYQIFTGDLAEDGTLSNIDWGSGVDVEQANVKFIKDNITTVAQLAESLNDPRDAKNFANEISSCLSGTKTVSEAGDGKYTISGLEAGYYLVKDADDSLQSTSHDAYTAYILEVVKDVIATPKSDVPSVDKQVHDEPTDAEKGHSDGYG